MRIQQSQRCGFAGMLELMNDTSDDKGPRGYHDIGGRRRLEAMTDILVEKGVLTEAELAEAITRVRKNWPDAPE